MSARIYCIGLCVGICLLSGSARRVNTRARDHQWFTKGGGNPWDTHICLTHSEPHPPWSSMDVCQHSPPPTPGPSSVQGWKEWMRGGYLKVWPEGERKLGIFQISVWQLDLIVRVCVCGYHCICLCVCSSYSVGMQYCVYTCKECS